MTDPSRLSAVDPDDEPNGPAAAPAAPAAAPPRPGPAVAPDDDPNGPAGAPAAPAAAEPRRALEGVLYETKRVVVGQDAMLEKMLVALLVGGHVLLEGVPGLAKTLTVRTL